MPIYSKFKLLNQSKALSVDQIPLYNSSLQGVPEKMFLSEKGSLLAKENFLGTPGIITIGYLINFSIPIKSCDQVLFKIKDHKYDSRNNVKCCTRNFSSRYVSMSL